MPATAAQAPVTALLFAAAQGVIAEAEEPRDQLQFGAVRPVLARTHIRGHRFGAYAAQAAVGCQAETQRRREAFLLLAAGKIRGVGLPVDDQAQDAVLAPEALEGEDLLVDPARARRVRGTDDDLAGGLIQGFIDDGAEVDGARQFVAVAEHRGQAPRHHAARTAAPHELLRHPIGLERAVQPGGPLGVAVAVADERPVFHLVTPVLPEAGRSTRPWVRAARNNAVGL
jgi:hypothetical protein